MIDLLDNLSRNTTIKYIIILVTFISVYSAITYYYAKIINFYLHYRSQPFFIVLTTSFAYIIYQSMHILANKEIQILFHLPPNQLPNTTNILTTTFTITAWLFVTGISVYLFYFFKLFQNKQIHFFLDLGIKSFAIILLGLSYKFVLKLNESQELIKKIAIYIDFIDTKNITLSLPQKEKFDKLLIIDSQNILVSYKDKTTIRFKFLKIPNDAKW